MQQLSFLDVPVPPDVPPVWNALDAEQKAAIVLRLARLIAAVAVNIHQEKRDE